MSITSNPAPNYTHPTSAQFNIPSSSQKFTCTMTVPPVPITPQDGNIGDKIYYWMGLFNSGVQGGLLQPVLGFIYGQVAQWQVFTEWSPSNAGYSDTGPVYVASTTTLNAQVTWTPNNDNSGLGTGVGQFTNIPGTIMTVPNIAPFMFAQLDFETHTYSNPPVLDELVPLSFLFSNCQIQDPVGNYLSGTWACYPPVSIPVRGSCCEVTNANYTSGAAIANDITFYNQSATPAPPSGGSSSGGSTAGPSPSNPGPRGGASGGPQNGLAPIPVKTGGSSTPTTPGGTGSLGTGGHGTGG